MKSDRPTALITGASSGIGEAYAFQLGTARRFNVILVARRRPRLAEVKERIERYWDNRSEVDDRPQVEVVPCDLAQKDARFALFRHFEEHQIMIDLLVNNAGFGSLGHFTEKNVQNELQMVEVNCAAALHLAHYFLGRMRMRREGTIINVCSTSAFQPFSYMATYGATKAFLLSHSLALAEEASKYEVRIVAHCPGPTKTEFHIAAGLPEKIDWLPSMSVDRVVKEALDYAEQRSGVVINGRLNRVLARLGRILPLRTSAKIIERALRRYIR